MRSVLSQERNRRLSAPAACSATATSPPAQSIHELLAKRPDTPRDPQISKPLSGSPASLSPSLRRMLTARDAPPAVVDGGGGDDDDGGAVFAEVVVPLRAASLQRWASFEACLDTESRRRLPPTGPPPVGRPPTGRPRRNTTLERFPPPLACTDSMPRAAPSSTRLLNSTTLASNSTQLHPHAPRRLPPLDLAPSSPRRSLESIVESLHAEEEEEAAEEADKRESSAPRQHQHQHQHHQHQQPMRLGTPYLSPHQRGGRSRAVSLPPMVACIAEESEDEAACLAESDA